MIRKKDMLPVGRTQKPYGIRGEIVLLFQKAGYAELDADFYFLEMDGIPVPFFVEELTGTTDTAVRVKFEDVADDKSASRLSNKRVLLPREMVKDMHEQAAGDWSYFVGFDVMDQYGKHLGSIREVDDATLNVLFVVTLGEEEYLIPAAEDFMMSIDEEGRMIRMCLPEGLLDG